MSVRPLKTIECLDLPKHPSADCVYRLLPKNVDEKYYRERTDRNIGWITREEQETLRHSVVGVAGCGGMGGLLASIFLRLGVGEVRIADCEVFDASNINRQFAATRSTAGKSKAFETAKMARAVTDDTTLVVYPQGITEGTAATFADSCSVICCEIEFWAVGSRFLLHQEARKRGVAIFNCNTVGFGTRLFFFEPNGYTIEEMLGLSYKEAQMLQGRVQSRSASSEEIRRLMDAVISGLIPEIPEYSADPSRYSTVREGLERMLREQKATIVATNPSMAAGFLADHVLFFLLRNSPIKRSVFKPVPAPGYLYFDAGFLNAKAVEKKGGG